MTYPLFSHTPTRTQVEQKINDAKQLLLQSSVENNEIFILMLDQRISDFTTALDSKKTLSRADKNDVLLQYHRFAKTLYACLNNSTRAQSYMDSYFNQVYYPVGVDEYYKPSPGKYYGSRIGTIVGAALILASFAAFTFTPLIATILLPIGITVLAPSLFALCVPEMLDPTQKKVEERLIFDTGVSMLQEQQKDMLQSTQERQHMPV
ncbi:hypothetical protein J2N86_08965 [Legionella lytica]|jgi:hypothetical protein|uniref:23, 7 kDa protein n=1 Tax=Legionella lytica TaxID=96232 RepID=A0ABY4Y5I7_9GAMM|nr:hypothetical protein [Legionella lytica]USQ12835.1 hypothetical protein J2N86_08965 [Legionella lytica]